MTEQELAKLIQTSIGAFLGYQWDADWIPVYGSRTQLEIVRERGWTDRELLDALSMNLETREKSEDVYEMDVLLKAASKVKEAMENDSSKYVDSEEVQKAAGELMELVLSNFNETGNLYLYPTTS